MVNTSFTLQTGPDTRTWLVLASVEDLNKGTPTPSYTSMTFGAQRARTTVPRTDSFALHFSGTGDELPQGTYPVQHATLGSFDLFVVPAGPNACAATFTRLIGPGQA